VLVAMALDQQRRDQMVLILYSLLLHPQAEVVEVLVKEQQMEDLVDLGAAVVLTQEQAVLETLLP
jgi:hypothetical protein